MVTSSDRAVHTDCDAVDKLLDINMVLSDKSQIGRMRDFYPIELFTIKNVRILFKNKFFADGAYFLPHALLLVVIRVPFLTHTFRRQLLSAAYSLFYEVYTDVSSHPPAETSSEEQEKVPQRRSQDSEKITWAEVGTLRKILCTIIAYAAALQIQPSQLRTDALGTHIAECKIGQGRHGCDSRWVRIQSKFAQASLRSMFQELDGIEASVPSRLKTAGCRIDGSGDWEIQGFSPELFSQTVFHSITEPGRAANDFAANWNTVMEWLAMLETVLAERDTEIGNLWLPNPAANSAIMARLLNCDTSSYGV